VGKRILITGASSGIGRALAVELGARGHALALSARRGDRLAALADQVAASGSAPRPVTVTADLSRRGEARALAAEAVAALGGVDVLVNNAASQVQGLLAAAGDRDEGRAVFEANVWSPLALIAELVPPMREQGGGTIANVSSLAHISPYPALGHYCASKGALTTATETLRLEVERDGIRVVEVALGPVDTPGSFQNRLLPGGADWLDRTRPGSAGAAARRIADAIEDGRTRRLIHPRSLGAVHALPGLGRRYARRMARRIDLSDVPVRGAGAQEIQAARDEWDRREAAAR
jgi:NAD(P)-dependent dehydrogenase (short-subunit alcohol dehydrogenase family)